MKRKVYIETSVISYLVSKPSNDVIKAACQQLTRAWWESGLAAVSPFISPYVVEEASAGDPAAARERIDTLRSIPVLLLTAEIPKLAEFARWRSTRQGTPGCFAYCVRSVSRYRRVADVELHAHRQSGAATGNARPLRGPRLPLAGTRYTV